MSLVPKNSTHWLKQASDILDLYRKGYTIEAIAKRYNTSQRNVHRILNAKLLPQLYAQAELKITQLIDKSSRVIEETLDNVEHPQRLRAAEMVLTNRNLLKSNIQNKHDDSEFAQMSEDEKIEALEEALIQAKQRREQNSREDGIINVDPEDSREIQEPSS